MIGRLGTRLFAVFTGALLGYVFGWIWGWSLFDPNSDIWALAAALFAILGLVLGVFERFRARAGSAAGAAIGLYLGWVLRTLLFGDVPGGWGILVLLIGMAAGFMGGGRLDQAGTKALLWAFYLGFFGGFLIDVVILDLVTGLVSTHSILTQAPAVVFCGLGGWFVGKWVARDDQMTARPSL